MQCRGCEPACPSGVPFGHLMEHTREALAERRMTAPRWLRAGFAALGRHRLLLAGSTLLAARPTGAPRAAARRSRPPAAPARPTPSGPTGGDVWLFTGCVMDAWMRETHRAAASLVCRHGCDVRRVAARVLRRPPRPRRAGAVSPPAG